MKSLAIIAPDTDSGKTIVTAALLSLSKIINGKSIAMKPVQTGAIISSNGRKTSPDLSTIEQLCEIEIPRDLYHYCAPVLLATPCSPHLASRKEITEVHFDLIQSCLVELHMRFRMTIVETAGGILSPLTETATNANLLSQIGLKSVLVVNNRIGSISMALSAIVATKAANIEILGIVLIDGEISPTHFVEEIYADNAKTIASFSGISRIVRLPRVENVKDDFFILTSLLEPFAKEIFKNDEKETTDSSH